MASYFHAFPPAPVHFTVAQSMAYEERRQQCLRALNYYNVDDSPDPSEHLLMLYRGVLLNRWDMEAIPDLLRDYYAEFVNGNRHYLPSDQLHDIRQDHHESGHENAVGLLGALYNAWRVNYIPPQPPLYGPHLAGQQPEPVADRSFTRAQQAAIIDQACELLSQQGKEWLERRRPGVIFSPKSYQVILPGFERAVLGSCLVREISLETAKQLLTAHHRNDSWRAELDL